MARVLLLQQFGMNNVLAPQAVTFSDHSQLYIKPIVGGQTVKLYFKDRATLGAIAAQVRPADMAQVVSHLAEDSWSFDARAALQFSQVMFQVTQLLTGQNQVMLQPVGDFGTIEFDFPRSRQVPRDARMATLPILVRAGLVVADEEG